MGYFDTLLRYFEFSGRTSRSQYWTFQLVCILLSCGAFYLDFRTMGRFPDHQHLGLFSSFVLIFHGIPSLTSTVRRLHDVGKSGWWWLLNLVPFGGLFVLVWTCYGSIDGSNEFGDDPRNKPRRDDDEPIQYRGVRTGAAKPRATLAADAGSTSTARFI